MVPSLVPTQNVQNVSFSGTAGTSLPYTSKNSSQFVDLRLTATQDCYYLISNDPTKAAATTATSSNASLLIAGAIEYIKVPSGSVISVVQSSTSGVLNTTEMRDVSSY